jgi:phosphatidylserine/phosphatidylglycerophosphate/cardiolipin synthase-like enzyme
MDAISSTTGDLTVTAYRGDAKTLLAFNFGLPASAHNLAGFTIQVRPKNKSPYFLYNSLQFKTPANHAQVATEPPYSSVNAPFHKFRWVHVPGSFHQGLSALMGEYAYTVTPRYFDSNESMLPLDPALSASVTIVVDTMKKGNLEVGFTRGYVQSQAFVNHFGLKALIRPKNKDLLFDTSALSGTNAMGETYSYADEYAWLGYTARRKTFDLIQKVIDSPDLVLDVFAYDLDEPDFIKMLLALATQGRIRLILDNASLHHSTATPEAEDQVEALFKQLPGGAALIKRGKFGRYSHDKVLIVSKKSVTPGAPNTPARVLTGSTNFAVTGFYVNSNHVLIYEDPQIAGFYAGVFQQAWDTNVARAAFASSTWGTSTFESTSPGTPRTTLHFSPHAPAIAADVLQTIVDRVSAEHGKPEGNVFFAVMEIDNGVSPVYTALRDLHASQDVFSYGISDNPGGIALYKVGTKTGVLVTGKPVKTQLPPPFNQVPGLSGHQVHHKFVVCGVNGDDPVVFCGSSNMAQGGEEDNGDNLLAIHDEDIAVAFAIEALLLVDHFAFLDRVSQSAPPNSAPAAIKTQAAVDAGWFLSTTSGWTNKYFDPNDLYFEDRELFG